MQREPNNRLGFDNIDDIKKHSWIRYYQWDELYKRKIDPPFIPQNKDNYDRIFVTAKEHISKDAIREYKIWLKHNSANNPFDCYYYIPPQQSNFTTPSTNNTTPNTLNKSFRESFISNDSNTIINWTHKHNSIISKDIISKDEKSIETISHKIQNKKVTIVESKSIRNMSYILSKYYKNS